MGSRKPSRAEEEYMFQQEALVRHRAAVRRARRIAAEERERLRREHFMRCPCCGMELETTVYRGVRLDRCFHCGGAFLDAEALETLAGHGGDTVRRIVEIFRPDLAPLAPEP